eukprot:TRINITY_DN16545_c4_g1_i1.p1 TRINITY_DN16545_c4_g1~~TRINITY_DN16545_c4_g1_i1.p1  ORF type:complete len:817 (+),score=76.72 TRINITY_DN16545_c4_g1_i1:157-2451(+)
MGIDEIDRLFCRPPKIDPHRQPFLAVRGLCAGLLKSSDASACHDSHAFNFDATKAASSITVTLGTLQCKFARLELWSFADLRLDSQSDDLMQLVLKFSDCQHISSEVSGNKSELHENTCDPSGIALVVGLHADRHQDSHLLHWICTVDAHHRLSSLEDSELMQKLGCHMPAEQHFTYSMSYTYRERCVATRTCDQLTPAMMTTTSTRLECRRKCIHSLDPALKSPLDSRCVGYMFRQINSTTGSCKIYEGSRLKETLVVTEKGPCVCNSLHLVSHSADQSPLSRHLAQQAAEAELLDLSFLMRDTLAKAVVSELVVRDANNIYRIQDSGYHVYRLESSDLSGALRSLPVSADHLDRLVAWSRDFNPQKFARPFTAGPSPPLDVDLDTSCPHIFYCSWEFQTQNGYWIQCLHFLLVVFVLVRTFWWARSCGNSARIEYSQSCLSPCWRTWLRLFRCIFGPRPSQKTGAHDYELLSTTEGHSRSMKIVPTGTSQEEGYDPDRHESQAAEAVFDFWIHVFFAQVVLNLLLSLAEVIAKRSCGTLPTNARGLGELVATAFWTYFHIVVLGSAMAMIATPVTVTNRLVKVHVEVPGPERTVEVIREVLQEAPRVHDAGVHRETIHVFNVLISSLSVASRRGSCSCFTSSCCFKAHCTVKVPRLDIADDAHRHDSADAALFECFRTPDAPLTGKGEATWNKGNSARLVCKQGDDLRVQVIIAKTCSSQKQVESTTIPSSEFFEQGLPSAPTYLTVGNGLKLCLHVTRLCA